MTDALRTSVDEADVERFSRIAAEWWDPRGKFAPLHKGHQLVIDTALAEADRVSVMVYANPDFPAMPLEEVS